MDPNGLNQNSTEPPPPYSSPDKPNGRSDTIEPVPIDQSSGPSGDAPAPPPTSAIVPPAGVQPSTTPVVQPVPQMTLPPVTGGLPPVNPLIGGDLGDIKITNGISPPPYLAPPPYEMINQPSRIIITNIHANPGMPIQNQPTGVPSLVPNQRAEKIENYAVLSIFSLICCCFPIGLLASLMSFQVTIYQHKGEIFKARFIADKARKLAIIGILIGSLSNIYMLMQKAHLIRQRIWSDQKTMLLSGFPSGLTEAGAELALDLDSNSSYGWGS